MINSKLSEISTIVANQLYYGFPYKCNEDLPLILLSKANTDCYNKYQLKKYKDLNQILTYDCKLPSPEVTVDNSNRDDWEITNPGCVSRKQWEKIALKICINYGLDIDNQRYQELCKIPDYTIDKIIKECNLNYTIDKIKKSCNLDYTIEKIDKICNLAFDITKNVIPCDVLTAISVHKKTCDYNIKLTRTKDECGLDYKLLVEKNPNCNLTRKEYIYLNTCNYSYDIISQIYKNKLAIEIENDKVKLVTPLAKYDIGEDLNFKDIVVDNGEKCISLIPNLLKDYTLTNIQKNNILNGTIYL